MKISRTKVDIAKARVMKGRADIISAGIPKSTLRKIMSGKDCRPETIGKLAKALDCDVLDIIETENN